MDKEQSSPPRKLLTENPFRGEISRPSDEHERSEEVPKADTEIVEHVYKGEGSVSLSTTHVDHGQGEREFASSGYSIPNKEKDTRGKKSPRKMRVVTFNTKVFFDSGECEDRPEEPDEEPIRISSFKSEDGEFPPVDTYQRFFSWERKDRHESDSELKRIAGTAVDEDTKGEEGLVSGGEQQEVSLSELLLSNTSPPISPSPALEVAHDAQPLVLETAGSEPRKFFCGLPIKMRSKFRGPSSPEITSTTQGISDTSEVPRPSTFHGSNSPAMGISCDLIKIQEQKQGPSSSSPEKLYNVIWHYDSYDSD